PVAVAVRGLVDQAGSWSGTATELLERLTALVGEAAARDKDWPKRPNALSGKLKRIAPALRKLGIEVGFDRDGRKRTIRIVGRSADQSGETSSGSSSGPESGTSDVRNDSPGDEFHRTSPDDDPPPELSSLDRHPPSLDRHRS